MSDSEVTDGKEKLRNILAFFTFGVLLKMPSEIILTATEDILAGSSIATGAATLTAGLANVILTLALPWVLQKLSYSTKIAIIIVSYVVGLIIIVTADSAIVRLIGFGVVELGRAKACMTVFAMTAFYSDVSINAIVAGTGVGTVLGSLYYTGVSTWICVSPRFTVVIATPLVFILTILPYVILDKSPLNENRENISFADVKYKALDDQRSSGQFTDELSLRRKFLVAWKIYLLTTYLFWQYFAESLSVKAIITTLAFPKASFPPRDHFTYYHLSLNVAKFLSRCYLLVFSITCPSVLRHVQIRKTWILATSGLVLLFFGVFATWYRFISHVEVILIFCFIMGVCTGCVYVYSPLAVADKITDIKEREFAQAMLTLGAAAGEFAGGFLGIYMEPYLRDHCVSELGLENNCLTRFPGKAGWTTNVHC